MTTFKNIDPTPMKIYDIDTNKSIILESGESIGIIYSEIRDGRFFVKLRESYLINEDQYEMDLYLKG